MPLSIPRTIDMHCHVGLIGDTWPNLGHMSDSYRKSITYRVFLLYGRIKPDEVSDTVLRQTTLRTIAESHLDRVVCLALDPVYDPDGTRREDKSHIWVHNNYVLNLKQELPDRILFGASVHPYDPTFEDRVREVVNEGAVLLKWVPSAQQINLADGRVGDALRFLATAGPNGKALPLLLHVGPEYAIPTSDTRTVSYDYLGWSKWDGFLNWWRFGKKWHVPDIAGIRANVESGLQAGAVIIFAHCGLPYVFSGWAGRAFEHSEFETVREYLLRTSRDEFPGRCFADVSACATPFRRKYFDDIKTLPDDQVLYGSDFPTPVFELSADFKEHLDDFKAVIEGHLDRLVIPEDNLFDVNLREMRHFFGDHRMFTSFSRLGFDREP
jgi:predicted TIM-barrel fold metal-dependent hydrolase